MVIATASLTLRYFLEVLKTTYIVIIQKLRKGSYKAPKAQYLIALLLTIRKVIKTLVVERLSNIVESVGILLRAQIRNRPQRSIELVVDLLVAQICTTQLLKKYIATLFSIDIVGAFNLVNYTQLLYILYYKGCPLQLVQQTSLFFLD